MRNKSVYSSSITICASGFDQLLESIFCLLQVVEAYSLQKIFEMLEEVSGSWWEGEYDGWSKTSSSNVFNVWSVVCAMWGQVLSCRKIGPFLLTNGGCRNCSFWCISLICWAHFIDIMVSLVFRKLQWIRWAADYQTVTMTFFDTSLALRSALELLSPATELVIAGCCIKSTFYCISQSDWEMVHCCWVEY